MQRKWNTLPRYAMAARGVIKLDTAQKLKIMTEHVLKQAKRVFGVPDFKYYALGDGISTVFKRSPGKLRTPKNPGTDQLQLTFGFT
ncbi:MAG TPA: hypothetical protein ENN33_04145 [Ignavibacteria bacterium]|nr:hypothetical protein [Ignavibacteria bacterium]